jgi:mono/diheme cytochrome c family protein
MRHLSTVVGIIALLTLTAAMAQVAESQDAAQASAEVPQSIPESAKRTTNPVPASAESVAQGLEMYASQCAMCHGANGDGSGELAKTLKMTMPDFSDPEALKKRTDGELFYIVTHGHGRMQGDGERLDPEWRWHMINAVRSMARP